MTKKNTEPARRLSLRQHAETEVHKTKTDIENMSSADIGKLVHELQVHQVELQMQNDELRRIEQELTESRAKYSDLYDFAPVGYITCDSQGTILEVNLTACSMLGVERNKLLHKHFQRFVVGNGGNTIHNHLQGIFQSRNTQTCEIRLENVLHENHFDARLESTLRESANGPQCRTAIIDITEQKIVEKALNESEQKYRAIFREAKDGVTLIDAETGYISDCNPEFERQSGRNLQQLEAMKIWETRPPEKTDDARQAFFKIREKGSGSAADLELQRPDGEIIPIEFKSSVVEIIGKQYIQSITRDISKRKKTEERLQRSERNLAEAQSLSHIGSWEWDPAADIITGSQEIYRIFGVDQGNLANLSDFSDRLHPDYREQVIQSMNDALKNKSEYNIQYQLVRPDGTVRAVHARGEVYFNDKSVPIRILGTIQDISENKQAEEALQRSESNYRTLVESSPDGIVSLEGKGYITDCNESIHLMLGYERNELKAMNFIELLADPSQIYLPSLRNNSSSKILELEGELVSLGGEVIPSWIKLVPIHDSNGNFVEFVMYIRDVSEHKRIDRLKDEFTNLVSHELRSPLTTVIGAINTALSEEGRLSPEETRQLLTDAAVEADSLSHILGNLLELSRAQANRLLLHSEQINIHNVTQQTIEGIKRQYRIHQFVLDIPENVPPVYADQLRVDRILYNLLENAAKYSPKGGEIKLTVQPQRECLLIGVSDQGIGISLEEQAILFKPFERLQEFRATGTVGTGLGLTVCERLVEAHGGRIWVESEPGNGSTFFLTLPYKESGEIS